MKRNYIIVRKRADSWSTRGSLDAAPLEAGNDAGPTLDFASMDDREARDYGRAPEVDAMVPDMPLTLIAPVAHASQAAASEEAWGLRALGVQESPFTGAGVKVAVLDTGIDAQHEAFNDQSLTLKLVNYTSDGPSDEHGHGTHCAGTIFGRGVGGVRIGVAPGVTHAFIGKVLGKGGGGTAILLRAIQDAVDDGCQIISMSLGFDFPGAAARLQLEEGLPPKLATAIALSDYRLNVRLFDRLGALISAQGTSLGREFLLFAAAGNESMRHVNSEFEMPAAPPSEAEGFVSIGAVSREEAGMLRIAPFSNTCCAVLAPGVGVLSAQAGTKAGLVAKSGTSMATPHAAGIAALYLEREFDSDQAKPRAFSRFRSQSNVLERMLNDASHDRLAAPYTAAQAGRGVLRAPRAT